MGKMIQHKSHLLDTDLPGAIDDALVQIGQRIATRARSLAPVRKMKQREHPTRGAMRHPTRKIVVYDVEEDRVLSDEDLQDLFALDSYDTNKSFQQLFREMHQQAEELNKEREQDVVQTKLSDATGRAKSKTQLEREALEAARKYPVLSAVEIGKALRSLGLEFRVAEIVKVSDVTSDAKTETKTKSEKKPSPQPKIAAKPKPGTLNKPMSSQEIKERLSDLDRNKTKDRSGRKLEQGEGWKLHLMLRPGISATDRMSVNQTLTKLKGASKIGTFKMGNAEYGKDITVYVGSLDASRVVAAFLQEKFDHLLLDPSKQTMTHENGDVEKPQQLNTDIWITDKIMARFTPDQAPAEIMTKWDRYGGVGIPWLKVHTMEIVQRAWNQEKSMISHEERKRNDAESYNALEAVYGSTFTGTSWLGPVFKIADSDDQQEAAIPTPIKPETSSTATKSKAKPKPAPLVESTPVKPMSTRKPLVSLDSRTEWKPGSATDSSGRILKRGEGWKLHLTVLPEHQDQVEKAVQSLEAASHIQSYKRGDNSGQEGKDFTVYVGHKEQAKIVAAHLKKKIGHLLQAPTGDALISDILLNDKVAARFDVGLGPEKLPEQKPQMSPQSQSLADRWKGKPASPTKPKPMDLTKPIDFSLADSIMGTTDQNMSNRRWGFSAYGAKGHQILVEDSRKKLFDKKNWDEAAATKRADALLKKLYGEAYTGNEGESKK